MFEKHVDFEKSQWSYADSLVFNFEVDDTTGKYNLLLMVRSSDDKYPYQNLYILTRTTFPSGEVLTSPLNVILQGEKGDWLGNCSGDICELVVPLQQNVRFTEIGEYRLSFQQYMRVNPLPGLYSLGFRIESAEKD